MCGIVGMLGQTTRVDDEIRRAVGRIRHRGPDDTGFWTDPESAVAFGHARLSVLDVSAAGHQPMLSACGQWVIVFNGEIYNHLQLRNRLGAQAPAWRGHSDTETLLACFAAWGVDETLRSLRGMFAIALWNRNSRTLFLARDRFGEKPLYYGYVGGAFAFCSELKALRELPGFSGTIDRGALALFLRHNYVPAPYSIFRGVKKLSPGSYLVLSEKAVQERETPTPQTYWSALEIARNGIEQPLDLESDADAVAALENLLTDAVRTQLLSDVPLGAFLSGGVDSSTVVALMQASATHPVKTFTIGFNESGYDEAKHARAIAGHLGTDHTEHYVSPADALATIPGLPDVYDEPFSDSSQIPTCLVSRLARQQVTVSLSGDGGDELLGGYNRYFIAARHWRTLEQLPSALRKALARIILIGSPALWDSLYAIIERALPQRFRLASPGSSLHKGARVLAAGSGMFLYRGLVSHWEPTEVVLGGSEPVTSLSDQSLPLPELIESMMVLDTMSYLPDDILVKVDRAAMAVGLETRVPLLDHRVFEFAWRLPMRYKIRNGVGKWLLRQVLYKHVPRNLVDRPKMGFAVPIASWLRGSLREWAEELLDEARLRREGFLNADPIRRKWTEHLAGKRNWQYHLWDVLMFQAWLEKQKA
jgi:asparagine synthase (glutamine-hydrolysing)